MIFAASGHGVEWPYFFLDPPEIVTSMGLEAIPFATTYIFDGPFSKFFPIVKLKVDGTIGVMDVLLKPEVVA